MSRVVIVVLALTMLVSCGGVQVIGDGPTIGEVLEDSYAGARARLVVAPVVDKTDPSKPDSLTYQLGIIAQPQQIAPSDMLGGIRDLLTTTLFQTNRYLLLERDELDSLIIEQLLDGGASVHPADRFSTLEGADLLLLSSITAFDLGESGGVALPVPIKLGDNDMGVLDLQMRTAYVAMDLCLVDVKSGRVVSTVSVEGKARKFGASMSRFYTVHGNFRLPGILSVFENTPIQGAINSMIAAATQHLIEKTPEQYYRMLPDQDNGKP